MEKRPCCVLKTAVSEAVRGDLPEETAGCVEETCVKPKRETHVVRAACYGGRIMYDEE